MPDLAGLPAATSGDVTDTDLLLMFDNEAASNKSRKITRADFLTGIARNGAAITPTTVTASGAISGPSGAIDALTVATSLTIGATVQKILSATGTLTLPTINAGTEGSATIAVTGAVSGDQALLQLPSTFPAGLLLSRVVVTGANTVTAYFYNVTGGNIAGAGYSVRASVIRFA